MKLPLTLALDRQGLPRVFGDPAAALQAGADGGELFLVELQGTLQVQLDGEEDHDHDSSSGVASGHRIGKLDMSVPASASLLGFCGMSYLDLFLQTRPTLLVGHHRLIGQIVKLNTPLAILKHTLPPREDPVTVPSPSMPSPLPPASSPLQSDRHRGTTASSPLKRERSPGVDRDEVGDGSHPLGKRVRLPEGDMQGRETSSPDKLSKEISPATPLPVRAAKTAATTDIHDRHAMLPLQSSPFLAPHPSSTPSQLTPVPRTPLNVSELRSGTHEIVGIIKSKILFSKRPEPVVKLDEESEED